MSHTFRAENGTVFILNSDLSGPVWIRTAGGREVSVPGGDLAELFAEFVCRPPTELEEDEDWTRLVGGTEPGGERRMLTDEGPRFTLEALLDAQAQEGLFSPDAVRLWSSGARDPVEGAKEYLGRMRRSGYGEAADILSERLGIEPGEDGA